MSINTLTKTNPWHIASGVLFAIYAIIVLSTFQSYGITSDETHHVKYGADIVRWYTSGFEDQALFQTKNTYLYGGLFDTVAYLFSQVLPLDRYDANHLCNALVGILGVLAAHRIGTILGGPTIGFFAVLFLILTPRYYGHTFNNPKDIPFAVFYLWSLYYFIRCIGHFPTLPQNTIIKTGLALGCALGIRIGGVLLIAYLLFFTFLYIWQSRLFQWHNIWAIGKQIGAILGIAYITMLVCWPWALTQPLTGPVEALFRFSNFAEPHISFFDGHYVVSTNIPRLYAPTWLTLILPEFVLFGFAISAFFLISKNRHNLQRLLLLFAGTFPTIYAVIMHTPLYDGLRHLLFVIPPLVVFSALGFSDILMHTRQVWVRRLGLTLGIFLLGLTAWDMVRLHPNQYIYFNRLIAGGLKKASEKYETDYWENTFKQGIQWIETHYPSSSKLRISGFSENIQHMIHSDQLTFEGYPEHGDIYIGVTRYDRHRKVPGEILHIIQTDNTPLLYLIRPDSTYQSDPFFAQSHFMHTRKGEIFNAEKKHNKALVSYLNARSILLQQNNNSPFLPHILLRIGNQYDFLERYEDALSAYRKSLDYKPKDAITYNNMGVAAGKMGDLDSALKSFQKAIALSPTYFSAYVNLGNITQLSDRPKEALKAYRQALKLRPNVLAVRKSAGLLSYQMGNFKQAESDFRQVLDRDPNDIETLYNLSLAVSQLEDYPEAQKIIQRVIALSPNYFDAYVTQGTIAMYLQHYPQAVEAYIQAIKLNPKSADTYTALGIALLSSQNHKDAQYAFEHALQYNPNDREAQQYLQQLKDRSTP